MWDYISFFICLVYGIGFSLINLARFRQFQSFYYDFGIFARAIFQLSRFKAPLLDHYTFGLINEFADHFNPGIAIFSPLFWLTKNPQILLIAQILFVALSGYFLYLTSKTVTKNHVFSLGILCSYLLFLGLQNAVIADFHPEVAALLPISISLYFLVKKKTTFFFVFLFLSFTFKESIGLFALFLGFFLILRQQYKLGLTTVIAGLFWLLITTKLIIPWLSPEKRYFYIPHYPISPLKLITNVFNETAERKTLFLSLLSFSFLPILAPKAWVLAFGDFIARFAPEASIFGNKDLTMHYSALTSIGLGFAAIQAYPILKRFFSKRINFINFVLILIPIILSSRPVLNGPINLIYNFDFFASIKNHRATEEFLAKTPKTGIIMTQNSLAVRFPDRELFLLRQEYPCYQPDYISINAESGQNPNNFWELNERDLTKIVENLKKDKNYKIYFQQNEKYLFQRTTTRQGDFSHQGISDCKATLLPTR